MGLSKVVGSNRLDKRRYSMLMARGQKHMWPIAMGVQSDSVPLIP